MKWLARVASGALAICGGIASCQKPEPAPTVATLRFPVVVLFESSFLLLCHKPGELTTMHTNYLNLNTEPPLLIDSEFKIYSLGQLRSVHGGLWLMAHPSAMTEVSFELEKRPSGREKARELFARQLEKKTWEQDRSAEEKALAGAATLLEMAQALQAGGDQADG